MEDDGHKWGWSFESEAVLSVLEVLIFEMQPAFTCKGKDRSYNSGKFHTFKKLNTTNKEK